MITASQGASLTQLAYGPAPHEASALGFAVLAEIYASDDTGVVNYGFLATRADGAAVIALRGTADAIEWVEDASIVLQTNPWGPGQLHGGFLALSTSLGVGPAQTDLPSVLGALGAVSLCGHSLGGAMARLLSMRLRAARVPVDKVFTWGEPKSGDEAGAGWGIFCAAQQHRGVNERDLVPMVPEFVPLLFPYVHAVTETTLGKAGANPVAAHAMSTYLTLEKAIP